MGSKGSKTEEPPSEANREEVCSGKNIPPLDKNRKCRDGFCALLFVAWWFGMFVIAIVAFGDGDGTRLIFGSDFEGNTCGSKGNCGGKDCGKQIYYPRQGLDAFAAGWDGTGDPLDVKLFGICVDGCPKQRDFVCTYEMENELSKLGPKRSEILEKCLLNVSSSSLGVLNAFGLGDPNVSEECKIYMSKCWVVMQPQVEVFWRCLSDPVTELSESSVCSFPEYQASTSADGYAGKRLRMPDTLCKDKLFDAQAILPEYCNSTVCKSGCVRNPRCAYSEVRSTSVRVESEQELPLSEQLITAVEHTKRAVGDLQSTWIVIFVSGFIGACVLGYLWLFILQKTIGCFVWSMIILSLLSMVIGTLICFMKAGKLESGWFVDAVTAVDSSEKAEDVSSSVAAVTDGQQGWWEVAGVLAAIGCGVYFLIIIVMRRKIRVAVAIFKEASVAVQQIKAALLFPAWTCICVLVLTTYSAVVLSYMITAGSFETSTISLDALAKAAKEQALTEGFRRQLVEEVFNIDSANVEIKTLVTNTHLEGIIVYHIFGFLWTYQFILGVSTMTVSGVICKLYWTPPEDRGKVAVPSVATFFKLAITKSFGTIAFGSILIAIVQLIRGIVAYINKKLKKRTNNPVVKIVMCVVSCCLWCFEKFLKYVSRMAYVYAAMMGTAFCESAKKAIGLLTDNAGRVAAVNFIGNFIFTLSKIVITAACVALSWMWLEHDDRFCVTTKSNLCSSNDGEISSHTLTLVVSGIVSFGVSSAYMHVYDIAVDSILLCFCVDVRGKPYYMGDSLKKLFKDARRLKVAKRNARKKASAAPIATSASIQPVAAASLKNETLSSNEGNEPVAIT